MAGSYEVLRRAVLYIMNFHKFTVEVFCRASDEQKKRKDKV